MTSTRVIRTAIVATTLMGSAQALHAQSCLGLPSLSLVGHNISTTASAAGADRLLLGRLGTSGQNAFIGVQGGYTAYELKDPKMLAVGADAGYAISVGSSGATLCPTLQSLYVRGPAYGGVRSENLLSSAGLSIGKPFRTSKRLGFVPFAQGALMHQYNLASFATTNPEYLFGTRARSRSSFGSEVGLGFGVQIGDVLTLRPTVTKPFGFSERINGGSEPRFSFSASFGFRK